MLARMRWAPPTQGAIERATVQPPLSLACIFHVARYVGVCRWKQYSMLSVVGLPDGYIPSGIFGRSDVISDVRIYWDTLHVIRG